VLGKPGTARIPDVEPEAIDGAFSELSAALSRVLSLRQIPGWASQTPKSCCLARRSVDVRSYMRISKSVQPVFDFRGKIVRQ